jgi:hypothetical protein
MAHADATAHQRRAMLRKLLPPTSTTPAGRQKNGREKRERKKKGKQENMYKRNKLFFIF